MNIRIQQGNQPKRTGRLSGVVLSLLLMWVTIISPGCYPALEREPGRPGEPPVPAVEREPERPEDALIPVRSAPRFSDDMKLRSLGEALKRNMDYLNRLPSGHLFQYGPHTFTSEQIKASQEVLLSFISRDPSPEELHKKITEEFLVYRAAGRPGNRQVLFTGYYEPEFEGSLQQDNTFRHPLYRKPDDLVEIDLSPFREELKGKSIVARIEGKRVVPYYGRQQIETEKVLRGRNLEMAWLKDPVDVAFLHIQGSGRIALRDGRMLSVGYHASNGRAYMSIGRYLIEKGLMSKEEMSMQAIRRYLAAHPEAVEEVLNQNPSYVFFRKVENGPLGAINVPLTPGRSLALDSRLFPKGALCFVRCRKPVVNENREIIEWADFSRFMVNQDTGGAIKGAGRADIFWGGGSYAELAAGHMRHDGDLYVLVKKP